MLIGNVLSILPANDTNLIHHMFYSQYVGICTKRYLPMHLDIT